MLVQEVYNSTSDGAINFGYKHITQSFKSLRNIIICSVGEKTGETLVEALSLRPRIQLALLGVSLRKILFIEVHSLKPSLNQIVYISNRMNIEI